MWRKKLSFLLFGGRWRVWVSDYGGGTWEDFRNKKDALDYAIEKAAFSNNLYIELEDRMAGTKKLLKNNPDKVPYPTYMPLTQ